MFFFLGGEGVMNDGLSCFWNSEDRALERISGPKKYHVTGEFCIMRSHIISVLYQIKLK